ncbi:hypothetical protein LY76DRAFT_262156 [Colletotrichum caudatum]|nr:hypothetical protein LY76DRAFT_262156 [Colletotrichum caudatum]
MEVFGGTVAIVQLLGLCTKCGSVATEIIRAYHGAPREFSDLVSNMDILRFRIQQLTNTQSGGLDIEAFLPDPMSDYFKALLEMQYQALLYIKGDTVSASGSIRVTQLRWATINRRKAQRVTKELTDINRTIDSAIALATFRLLSFQQLSINAISASQSALSPMLNALVEPIRTELSEGMSQMQLSIANIEHRVTAHPQKRQEVEARKIQKGPQRPRRQIQPNHNTPQSLAGLEKFETSPTSTYIISRFPFAPPRNNTNEPQETVTGTVIYHESGHQKRLRFLLKAPLWLFYRYIVNFEIAVRLSSRYWHMMPWLECRPTVVNVRSRKAEIFAACQAGDLDRVKTLIDCHEASINDVDEGQHRGLLEYALAGLSGRNGCDKHKATSLVQYLLHNGCNSDAFQPVGTFKAEENVPYLAGPAITNALSHGATDIVRLMLQKNLRFESSGFSFNPGFCLCSSSRDIFLEQVHLLRSLGFEDWTQEDVKSDVVPYWSIIHGAAALGNLEDVIYTIEVLGIDVNFGHRFDSPIDCALSRGHIGIAAVLHELGAVSRTDSDVWHSTGFMSRAHHWLLLRYSRVEGSRLERGLETFESDDITLSYWKRVWLTWACASQTWHFESAVRIIQHILFHKACVWEPLDRNRFHHWCFDQQLRAQDLARAWSHDILPWPQGYDSVPSENWKQTFDALDEAGVPNVSVRYSDDGWVERRGGDDLFDTFDTNPDLRSELGSDFNWTVKQIKETPHDPTPLHTTGVPNRSKGDESDKSTKQPFRTQEMFHIWQSITSDQEGRRQLSRYPLVKALCCALQLSGYRAEMDGEGDIWYDVDDGDPYFDCLEQPPEPSDWEGPGLTCEMCTDPERFGLDYIVREAEEGLRQAKEERRKLGKERSWDRD